MKTVETHYHPEPLEYSGQELASHFGFRRFAVLGDSAIAFVGPCRVALEDMVDLEDVRARAPIYSPRMLHLIIEHFEMGLVEAVCWQRLAVRRAAELLVQGGVKTLRVSGDDIFVDGRKASVSIATRSPVSALIHFGINIQTEGTPVPTWGMEESSLDPARFGSDLLRAYADEFHGVQRALSKVRGVP